MSIRIITDSASDITKEEASKLGVEMISMEVNIDNKIYLDGDNLSKKEFYNQLEQLKDLPKTSQINPYRFAEVFDKITKDGDQAIVILVSSKLSGTYQNAQLLAADYDNIYVIDSLNASIGEKLLILYALQLIKENKSFDEIITILEKAKHDIVFIARLDTLKYLRKGGRISALVAFAGEALHIKPIIGIVDGGVKMLGKGKGIKNSNKIVTKIVTDSGGIDEHKPYGVVYSGNDDQIIKDYIEENKNILKTSDNIPIYQLGCTIGTHIGPNGIGVAFFKKTC